LYQAPVKAKCRLSLFLLLKYIVRLTAHVSVNSLGLPAGQTVCEKIRFLPPSAYNEFLENLEFPQLTKALIYIMFIAVHCHAQAPHLSHYPAPVQPRTYFQKNVSQRFYFILCMKL
jgi:hypothetical protein